MVLFFTGEYDSVYRSIPVCAYHIFKSSGASVITVALTALLMNSRQSFYSLTFLEDFKKMGKRMLYMIHTMTDETYAVNCTLELPQKEKEDAMFLVAFFSRCYWMIGAVLGGVLGQLIPWDMEGIDFCMTALFVIIFIDQWEKADRHTPALAGLWDRHYLPAHLWGFRFYASGIADNFRTFSGITEMYSQSLFCTCLCGRFSASCTRISSTYAPRTPTRNLGTTDKKSSRKIKYKKIPRVHRKGRKHK